MFYYGQNKSFKIIISMVLILVVAAMLTECLLDSRHCAKWYVHYLIQSLQITTIPNSIPVLKIKNLSFNRLGNFILANSGLFQIATFKSHSPGAYGRLSRLNSDS